MVAAEVSVADDPARPGAEPATRPGAETATRPEAEAATRPGAEPATRPGADAATRPGAEAATRPGAETATRPEAATAKRPGAPESWRPDGPWARGLGAALLALALGGLVSPGLARRVPQYAPGDYAVRSVRAPYDFSVVDPAATERRRHEARAAAPLVFRVDTHVAAAVSSRLSAAFAPIARLFEDADAHRVPAESELAPLSARRRTALGKQRAAEADARLSRGIEEALPAFESAVGVQLAPAERAALTRERFSPRVIGLLESVLTAVYAEPVVADRVTLVPQPDDEPGAGSGPRPIVLRDSAGGERPAGRRPLRTRSEATAQAAADVDDRLAAEPSDLRQALTRILQASLVPNASFDRAMSDARAEASAAAVLPVSLSFRRNQLIVGEGQEVTAPVRLVLDELHARQAPAAFGWRAAGSSLLFFLLLVAGLFRRGGRVASERTGGAVRDLVFLASGLALSIAFFRLWLLAANLLSAGNPALPPIGLALLFPLAAVPMLTQFVLNDHRATAQLLVGGLAAGLLVDQGIEVAGATVAIGLTGLHAVARCSSRACLVRAGLRTAGVAAAAALAVALVAQLGPLAAAVAVLLGAAGGFGSGLLVIALAPAVEWMFGYATRISLLEMISYEHPLLKRLIAEAPGTFQHSATVSVLADAAAAAIGADRLLVRVGALYHDVGKIDDPGVFIENQVGPNPHDALPPDESARAIRRHVTEGVQLVGRYGLGERVADFVREHHGTRPIVYFLERARAAGLSVDEAAYTYPGPRPASRETAILMLADQVEAVARANPGRDAADYRATVAATIEHLRGEGQLDEAPITAAEFAGIRDALAEALVRVHHRRIPYPGQEGGPPLTETAIDPRPAPSATPPPEAPAAP